MNTLLILMNIGCFSLSVSFLALAFLDGYRRGAGRNIFAGYAAAFSVASMAIALLLYGIYP